MDLDMFLESSPNCELHFDEHQQDLEDRRKEFTSRNLEEHHNFNENVERNKGDNKNWENMSISNVDSSKRLSSIMAGKKAREKKKMYVETLEEKVKELEKEVLQYDEEIKNTKEALSKLVFSAKYNENKLTYAEIESCISVEDPNEDRINMLIDMIKVLFYLKQFRVGGVGIERQAKIDYFMKQLTNTLFLPLQRYLFYCSEKGLDIFKENEIDDLLNIEPKLEAENYLPWTKDFLSSIQLTESQKTKILKMKPFIEVKKSQVHSLIHKINQIKEEIKEHEKKYEEMIDEIRNVLNPIQGGVWLIFTDRIRYRGEIILDSEKEMFNETKMVGFMPTKKLKKK